MTRRKRIIIIFLENIQEKEKKMPIFEYRCNKCGNIFEELLLGERNRTFPCPRCGNEQTEKIVSVIGGITSGRKSAASPCESKCKDVSGCAAAAGSCCPHLGV